MGKAPDPQKAAWVGSALLCGSRAAEKPGPALPCTQCRLSTPYLTAGPPGHHPPTPHHHLGAEPFTQSPALGQRDWLVSVTPAP